MLVYLLFVIGFVLLIKGADYLVDGASSIAKKYHVSDMMVGLTIVSFGTSMPEMIVNVLASIDGNADIALGNIFGSNIANILLILGVSAIICPLPIQRSTVLSEIPFSLIASLLIGFLANAALFDTQAKMMVSRLDGAILLFFFWLFMVYVFKTSQSQTEEIGQEGGGSDEVKIYPTGKAIAMIAGGVAGLFLGGKFVVDGAVSIAEYFGMSESLVGLTVVAVGTSLPELITSATAAYKKNTDIAVGNVVGSNIFNILWVLGLSATIYPLEFSVINNDDLLMVIFSSTFIIVLMIFSGKRLIGKKQGILLVLLYIAYTYFIVKRG